MGLMQEALVRMASAFHAWIKQVAELFRRAIEEFVLNPPPALLKFAADLRLIEQSPPVPGYEAILIDKGHHPLAARILAGNLLRLGRQRLEEICADRKLASAVFGVVKAKNATPLVISRRARPIMAALDDWLAMPALRDAWAKAYLPETESSFRQLVERAMERDAAACSELAVALKPYLADPRGRIPSVATLTHELLLTIVDRAYTYDPIDDGYNDPATRATRVALNAPTFEPRPARRRQKARQKRRIPSVALG